MIKVIDDFLSGQYFSWVRDLAINTRFTDWLGPDGQLYKRISILDVNSDCYKLVKSNIEHKFRDGHTEVEMLGMAYRLNYAGEEPNQSIHTDVGWGTHAMVLYLNESKSFGGTGFWKHVDSGKERLSPHDLMTYVKVRNDWEDSSKWDLCEVVQMIPNRAVIYESELFHSRYPFDAFGSTPEDGRLILVAFFTPVN